MILLYFLELYILHDDNYYLEKLNDQNTYGVSIKKLIIAFSFALIIYLLLHQINQQNNKFEFKLYNKLLILFMLIDIVTCLFFTSKMIINNIVCMIE